MSQSQPEQIPNFDPQLENLKPKNLLTLTLAKQSSNASNKKLKTEPENSHFSLHNTTQQRNHSNASARQNDTEEQDISPPDSDRARVSRERISPGARNLFVIKQSTHHPEHQKPFIHQNLDDSWHSHNNRSLTPRGDHHRHKHKHHHKHRQAGHVKPKKALLAKREEMNIVAAKAKRYTESGECESLHVSRTNFDDFTVQSFDTVGRGNYTSYRRKSCECSECGGCSKFEKLMQNYPGVPALIPHERNIRKILVADEKSPSNKNAKKRFEAAKTKMKIINKGLIPTKSPPLQTIQSNPGTMVVTQDNMTTPKGGAAKMLQKLSSFGGFSRRSSVAKSTKSIIDIEQKDLLETVQQEASSTKGRLSTERGLTKILVDQNSLHNIQEVLGLEKILSTYEHSPTAAGANKDEKKMLLTPRKYKLSEEYTFERREQRSDSFKDLITSSREMRKTLSRLQTNGASTSRHRDEKVENFKQIEHKILKTPKLKLKKITKPQVAANKNATIKKVYCNPGDLTPRKISVPESPKFHVAPNFFRIISRNQASLPMNKTTGPNMQSRSSVTQLTSRDLPSPSMEYYNLKTEEDVIKVPKVTKRVKVKPIKNLEIAVLPFLGGVAGGLKSSPITAKTPKSNKTPLLESPRMSKTFRDARLLKNYQSLKKK